MEDNVYYVIGPGTTTRSIMERLELPNTLLGVDIVLNKQLVANDVTEETLYQKLQGQKGKIVLTAIGGQGGHILGRGNQQISPRVIRAVGKETSSLLPVRINWHPSSPCLCWLIPEI